MRSWKSVLVCAAALVVLGGILIGQQGPARDPGATVAKPRKPGDAGGQPAGSDLPKIPSQYKKDKTDLGTLPTFTSNVDTVTVDVAVLDNKGHFIPGIPKN